MPHIYKKFKKLFLWFLSFVERIFPNNDKDTDVSHNNARHAIATVRNAIAKNRRGIQNYSALLRGCISVHVSEEDRNKNDTIASGTALFAERVSATNVDFMDLVKGTMPFVELAKTVSDKLPFNKILNIAFGVSCEKLKQTIMVNNVCYTPQDKKSCFAGRWCVTPAEIRQLKNISTKCVYVLSIKTWCRNSYIMPLQRIYTEALKQVPISEQDYRIYNPSTYYTHIMKMQEALLALVKYTFVCPYVTTDKQKDTQTDKCVLDVQNIYSINIVKLYILLEYILRICKAYTLCAKTPCVSAHMVPNQWYYKVLNKYYKEFNKYNKIVNEWSPPRVGNSTVVSFADAHTAVQMGLTR